jgi:predicted component of type VI protein secretion system
MGERAFRFELAPVEQQNVEDARDEETRKVVGIVRMEREPVLEPLILTTHSQLISDARWELCDAVVAIGRDESRQVCLPHESVSRLHAQIVRQPTGYFITDMHSRNGTLLNGKQLDTPAALASGDVLTLGEVVLLCEAVPVSGRGIPASVTRTIQHQPSDGHPGESTYADEPEMVFLQRRSAVDRAESPRLAPQAQTQDEHGGTSSGG